MLVKCSCVWQRFHGSWFFCQSPEAGELAAVSLLAVPPRTAPQVCPSSSPQQQLLKTTERVHHHQRERMIFFPITSHPSPEQQQNKSLAFGGAGPEVELPSLFDLLLLGSNQKATKCLQHQQHLATAGIRHKTRQRNLPFKQVGLTPLHTTGSTRGQRSTQRRGATASVPWQNPKHVCQQRRQVNSCDLALK